MEIIWKGSLMFLVITILSFGISNNNKVQTLKREYKQSFEMAVDASLDSLSYSNSTDLERESAGGSIYYDTDRALMVFYDILKGNLSISHVDDLKMYIAVKVFVLNDRMIIYDNKDNKEEYLFNLDYNGTKYLVTLDDESYYPFDKNQEVAKFVNTTISQKLNAKNLAQKKYLINLDKENKFYNRFDKTGFLVFSEGIPMPSLVPFRTEKYYVNSIAGDLVIREDLEY
ncbi:MAG: hypothetical protein Q8N88_02740 [Nanoarchaeota archaeon]|nr:hypothetical protein [Nanoarchaeota archaeon]